MSMMEGDAAAWLQQQRCGAFPDLPECRGVAAQVRPSQRTVSGIVIGCLPNLRALLTPQRMASGPRL